MAKPLHSLQNDLQRLIDQKNRAEAELIGVESLIENTNKQIADFKEAIDLLQKSKN